MRDFEKLKRYKLIVDALMYPKFGAKGCTTKELVKVISHLIDPQNLKADDTKSRAVLRDIDDLKNFGFYIQTKSGLNFIDKSEDAEKKFFSLQNICFHGNLLENEDSAKYIQTERNALIENKYFSDILNACQSKNIIYFAYQSFWEDEKKNYELEPYLIKAFRNRWYLVGKDIKTKQIRSFSLDRFHDFKLKKKDNTFKMETPFDAEDFYKDCFGISKPYEKNKKPEDIELIFEKTQGKYVKNLPLHNSQEIVNESDGEVHIKLHVYITYEFVQEILHFGETVKVLSPQSLVETMKKVSEQMLDYYANNKEVERSHLY